MLKKFSVASVFVLLGGVSIATPSTIKNTTTQNQNSSSAGIKLSQDDHQPQPSNVTGPILSFQLTGKQLEIEQEEKLKAEKLQKEAEQLALQKEQERLEKERLEKLQQQKKFANPAQPTINPAPVAVVAKSEVEQIIINAANKYGMNPNHMLRIARCESGFNPNAINYNYNAPGGGGNPAGLFQHLTGYWPSRAAKYGWAGASVFNAQANAEVTAQMARDSGWGAWECR